MTYFLIEIHLLSYLPAQDNNEIRRSMTVPERGIPGITATMPLMDKKWQDTAIEIKIMNQNQEEDLKGGCDIIVSIKKHSSYICRFISG